MEHSSVICRTDGRCIDDLHLTGRHVAPQKARHDHARPVLRAVEEESAAVLGLGGTVLSAVGFNAMISRAVQQRPYRAAQ